jgi:hypothetical protein
MIKLACEELVHLLPSFPSALQLRVSFGLLNNQPPFVQTKGRMKK